MKKFLTVLSCVLIFSCCLCCASCNSRQTENQNLFVFLSVRLKGNGDGTITAVAQNEFAIGPSVLPITLTLYSSETQETDVANMKQVDSLSSNDLNIFQSINIVERVEKESYFCAQITYSLRGEIRHIQSKTLRYNVNGNRE